jgi:COP9 signalosome complex subunit 1
LISHSDIAVYGTLTALSSFTRSQIVDMANHPDFKQFIELEPPLRDLLAHFIASRYQLCLDALRKMENDLYLDMYLHQHVAQLFTMIKKKLMIQFTKPYNTVGLQRMAGVFSLDVPTLMQELVEMIIAGDIDARIDAIDQVLVANSTDSRTTLLDTVLRVGDDYELGVRMFLLKAHVWKQSLPLEAD